MPLTEKQAKRTNFILDLAVFMALALYSMNSSTQADPGEIIFLFVFENLVMAFAFTSFFIIFSPWHNFYLKKQRLLKNPARPRVRVPLFKAIFYALIGFGIVLCISLIVLIFLNQLAVELIISFLKDNSYHFESIEILSGGMFFDGSIIRSMQLLFGQSYVVFFWVLFFKHLLSHVLVFFSHPDLKSNNFLTLAGTRAVISQTIMSPVSVFLACILLVALSAIYGAQTWIILVTLGAFRLIFLLLSASTARFFTTV